MLQSPATRLCLLVTLILLGGMPRTVAAQSIQDNFWITDGSVRTILPVGNLIYIGGDFTYVGPFTGNGAAVDATTGQSLGLPRVNGQVYAIAPDGAGGWYIGGDFTDVGGVARTNLAHIMGDHTLAAWDPSPSGAVLCLAVNGSTVYVGGAFDMIGGAARNRIAALDAGTGNATAWNPNADVAVYSVAVSGSTVYVGGAFTSIGGATRSHIAALDAATGNATSWDPNANAFVNSVAVNGSTV
jgi:hypothetical protein